MSQTIFIRPQTRKCTDGIKEKNSYFLCPSNTVLTGRCHSGDENGISEYKFSGLHAIDINGKIINGDITIEDLEWSEWHKQSDSADFFCQPIWMTVRECLPDGNILEMRTARQDIKQAS